MNNGQFGAALLLTLFAGLATGAGSLIALLSKKTTPRFLSVSLGFSAGVMIFVSLVELFNDARAELSALWGDRMGYLAATGGFFAGMGLIALIDHFVPTEINPHEARSEEAAAYEATGALACAVPSREERCGDGACDVTGDGIGRGRHGASGRGRHRGRRGRPQTSSSALLRTGVLTAIVIALHNFPEGIATFFASMKDLSLGGTIAFAIAIHNIPEGISVSVPVYYATGSRKKAFWLSFASGLSEPVGALLGFLVLQPFLGGPAFGFILAAVAGIMIYISLDELLPSAREFGESHLAMAGLAGGIAVMALSLAFGA